jgi:hypothetical protein
MQVAFFLGALPLQNAHLKFQGVRLLTPNVPYFYIRVSAIQTLHMTRGKIRERKVDLLD